MSSAALCRVVGALVVVVGLVAADPAQAHDPGHGPAPDGASADGGPAPDPGDTPGRTTVVTATRVRPQQTASERHVDGVTLSVTPGIRSGDDLLRQAPGLLVTRHGSEGKAVQIYLRGIDAVHGADVEVLLDGIPLNELSNVHGQGYLDLGLIIPELVRSIGVAKGSFQLSQGNFATAGSVRFELGVPEELRGTRVSYEAGSTNRHRILLLHAPVDSSPDTFFAVEGMHDAGYGQNREAQRAVITGKTRLVDRPDLTVTALVIGYLANFGEPSPVPIADVDRGRLGFYDTDSRDTQGSSRRALGSLTLRTRGDWGRLQVTAYGFFRQLTLNENFTGYLLYPEEGDRRFQHQIGGGSGVRSSYQLPLPHRITLLAAAAWQLEANHQLERQLDERLVPFRFNRDYDVTQNGGSLELGLRWAATSWFRAEGGVRLDVFDLRVADHLDPAASGAERVAQVSPRLITAFTPDAQGTLTLFASYGRGVRAPEARAVLSRNLPPAATPLSEYKGGSLGITSSDAVEVGARWKATRWATVALAGFATFISNEVVFDHVSGINVAVNATRRLGGELELRLRPRPWLEIIGDFTAVDARFVESGDPVPGAPTLFGTLQATLIHPIGLRAGARLLYLAPRPLANGATAQPVVIVDLYGGYRWRWLELGLRAENLASYPWREGEFHYASWFDRSQARSFLPSIHYAAGPPLQVRGTVTLWYL